MYIDIWLGPPMESGDIQKFVEANSANRKNECLTLCQDFMSLKKMIHMLFKDFDLHSLPKIVTKYSVKIICYCTQTLIVLTFSNINIMYLFENSYSHHKFCVVKCLCKWNFFNSTYSLFIYELRELFICFYKIVSLFLAPCLYFPHFTTNGRNDLEVINK